MISLHLSFFHSLKKILSAKIVHIKSHSMPIRIQYLSLRLATSSYCQPRIYDAPLHIPQHHQKFLQCFLMAQHFCAPYIFPSNSRPCKSSRNNLTLGVIIIHHPILLHTVCRAIALLHFIGIIKRYHKKYRQTFTTE